MSSVGALVDRARPSTRAAGASRAVVMAARLAVGPVGRRRPDGSPGLEGPGPDPSARPGAGAPPRRTSSGRRHHAAHAAVEAHRGGARRPRAGRPRPSGPSTARRPGSRDARGQLPQSSAGKGNRVMGRNRPALARGARALDRGARDAGRRAVRDERPPPRRRVLAGPADLARDDLARTSPAGPGCAARGPRRRGRATGRRAARGPSAPVSVQSGAGAASGPEVRRDRLHRLAHDAVGEHHHRRPVALGELEGVATSSIASAMDAGASTGTLVVAVAVALGRLEVVALGRADAAEARARRASR